MEEKATTLRALSRSRRLVTLVVLRERGGAMTPEELATEVASREAGVPPSEVERDHFERVLLSFRHSHFPALTEADILTRTPSEGRVRLAADNVDVHRILDALFGEDAESSEGPSRTAR